jgi:Protein of unknown function (DUF1566)/Trypsin-like peptidase domain
MFLRLAFLAASFAALLPALVHAQSAQSVFARVSPSIVVIKTGASQGSGIAVSVQVEGFGKATLIATNCHVVKGETVVLVTHKTTEGIGIVTACDEVRDIALVSVSGEIPVVERRNALSLSVGETVFAVGAPRGLELSITNGIVSQLRVTETGQAPMIQTTAPISPGSSGGGLFDAQGRLIGLTTYMLRESQGLNFALPSEWIAAAEPQGSLGRPSSSLKQPAPGNARPAVTVIKCPLEALEASAGKYTKISNEGCPLPDSITLGEGAGQWACTRDNTTGLIWEVKTRAGLRSQELTYSWPRRNSSRDSSIGGFGGGTCTTGSLCGTEALVATANSAGLCGTRDWRMPSVVELNTIIDRRYRDPSINTVYFPNTRSTWFWSASEDETDSVSARYVDFFNGTSNVVNKTYGLLARLVHGGR